MPQPQPQPQPQLPPQPREPLKVYASQNNKLLISTFQNNDNDFNVEVINSGVQGADSFNELELIKTRLLSYAPDMVIVYDGWNDLRAENSPEIIYDNWKSICDLGVENNFDVIIALQPIVGFGNKSLTEQELIYSTTGTNYKNTPLINSLDDYNN